MKETVRKHYYWIVAAIVLLVQFVYGGICNNLNGMFVIPVTQTLQISRTSFSMTGLAKSLVSFGSSFFSVILMKRFGYRKCTGVLLIIAALGVFLMSRAQSIFVLCVGVGIMGLSDGVCVSAGPSYIVSDWFHRHRGAVLGCVTAATGLGGSTICILLTGVMERFDWRAGYVFFAVILLVIAVIALLLVRNRPEDIGLKPYGEGELYKKEQKKPISHWEGYSLQELWRKPFFYLMLLGFAASCLLSYIPLSASIPHMQDCGLTVQQATAMHSMMMLLLTASKMLAGVLCDKIGVKRVAIVCLVCTVLCMLSMGMINGIVTASIGMIFLALSLPITGVITPLLVAELFGYKGYAASIGICVAMVQIGNMLTGPVTQSTFDRMGSYHPAFWVGIAGAVLLIGLFLLVYWLADRDKKKNMANKD